MTPCPPRLQLYSLPEQILPPKNWSLIGYNSLLHDTRIKSERGVPKIQEIVLVMIGTAIFQFWPKGAEKMEIKDFNLSSNWEWGWEMGNGNGNREYPYSQSQEMSGRHWIGAFRSLQTRGASLSVGGCNQTRVSTVPSQQMELSIMPGGAFNEFVKQMMIWAMSLI